MVSSRQRASLRAKTAKPRAETTRLAPAGRVGVRERAEDVAIGQARLAAEAVLAVVVEGHGVRVAVAPEGLAVARRRAGPAAVGAEAERRELRRAPRAAEPLDNARVVGPREARPALDHVLAVVVVAPGNAARAVEDPAPALGLDGRVRGVRGRQRVEPPRLGLLAPLRALLLLVGEAPALQVFVRSGDAVGSLAGGELVQRAVVAVAAAVDAPDAVRQRRVGLVAEAVDEARDLQALAAQHGDAHAAHAQEVVLRVAGEPPYRGVDVDLPPLRGSARRVAEGLVAVDGAPGPVGPVRQRGFCCRLNVPLDAAEGPLLEAREPGGLLLSLALLERAPQRRGLGHATRTGARAFRIPGRCEACGQTVDSELKASVWPSHENSPQLQLSFNKPAKFQVAPLIITRGATCPRRRRRPGASGRGPCAGCARGRP